MMVVGLLAAAVFAVAAAGLRRAAGVRRPARPGRAGASIYDPAARGYLVDANPPERQGEAFGLYGAAQMGGLLLGPAIGAFGAERFGGISFVFVFSGVAALLAAIPIGLRGRETAVRTHPAPPTTPPSSRPTRRRRRGRAAADIDGRPRRRAAATRGPTRLWNRGLSRSSSSTPAATSPAAPTRSSGACS